MYFKYDENLDHERINAGERKFALLSNKEKDVYMRELSMSIKQQLFYAGLDPIQGHSILVNLEDSFRKGVISGLNRNSRRRDEENKKQEEDSDSDGPSSLGDLLGILFELRNKCKKEPN